MARKHRHYPRNDVKNMAAPVTCEEALGEAKAADQKAGVTETTDIQEATTTTATQGKTSDECTNCTNVMEDTAKELTPDEMEKFMAEHGYHKVPGFTMIIPVGHGEEDKNPEHACKDASAPMTRGQAESIISILNGIYGAVSAGRVMPNAFGQLVESRIGKIKRTKKGKVKLRKKDLKRINKMFRNGQMVNRRIISNLIENESAAQTKALHELICNQASVVLDEVAGVKSAMRDITGMISALRDDTAAVKDGIQQLTTPCECECDCAECPQTPVDKNEIQLPQPNWTIDDWANFICALDDYMDN